ncbi:MAG: ABC transporter permease [Candidatus Acidiferrum sp.]
MRSLVGNDLRLHGRGIAWVQLGILGFIALLLWVNKAKPTSTVGANVAFIFNINFLIAVLWGEWLVSREKTKGTLAWLRSLPVSDRSIVTAKFLTCALCVVSLWVLSSIFVHSYFFPSHWVTWGVYLLCLLGFSVCSLSGRWRFRQKLGMMLPLVLVLAPLLAILLADKAGFHVVQTLAAFYADPMGKELIVVALVAFCGGIWWATVRWVSRSDTYELLE